jgi:dsRNA-specific ribonuclease
LEFFGDCILDFLIGRELYESFPKRIDELRERFPNKKDEALLTDILHDNTNDERLSEIVIAIEPFDKSIQCGSGQPLNEKIRAGALEAFVAAVYDDKGIEKTRTIVAGLFEEYLKNAKPIVSWKNKLQECVQKQERTAQVKDIIDYKTRRQEGTPDHNALHISEVYIRRTGKDVELWGTGYGRKQQDAEKEAAKNAFMKHCIEQR